MTSPPSRRRARSWRLSLAIALLVAAVAAAVGAVMFPLTYAVWAALAAGVLAGVASTKLVHNEVVEVRIEAGADRAQLARLYRDLTHKRAEENAEFIGLMEARFAAAQHQLFQVREELDAARLAVYEAELDAKRQRDRAQGSEAALKSIAVRVGEAEARAVQAQLRTSEVEAELDVLRSELEAWEMLNETNAHGGTSQRSAS